MTKPLALCCYENRLLGSQLVNRLQDLGYRVRVADRAHDLAAIASQEQPLLVLTDLGCGGADICCVINQLRQTGSTKHIPILAFGPQGSTELQAAAHSAGATLVAIESGLLQQLPRLLDQVLELE